MDTRTLSDVVAAMGMAAPEPVLAGARVAPVAAPATAVHRPQRESPR
jgi:hypothetical protein